MAQYHAYDSIALNALKSRELFRHSGAPAPLPRLCRGPDGLEHSTDRVRDMSVGFGDFKLGPKFTKTDRQTTKLSSR